MLPLIAEIPQKATDQRSKEQNQNERAIGSVTEKEETVPVDVESKEQGKPGLILRWRYTRPVGKVPNKGQYLPTLAEAQADLWKNAATQTSTTDGYPSAGHVNGTVIKPCAPQFQKEDDDDVVMEKEDPSLPASDTRFRWIIKRLTVVAILYAETHKPIYTYFNEDTHARSPQISKGPPNVPQNPPTIP